MRAVFDSLVVFPFFFCNLPSKSNNLMLATFISSKCHSACISHLQQLTNIKLQTQFFTTVTLVQFCVSKSPPFNVTSLITVQLSCNNTEVVNTLHP